jgi:hypothetical protein
VAKTEDYPDQKAGKSNRRSPVSTNAHSQVWLRPAKPNPISFSLVVNAVWSASADQMLVVKPELEADFGMPLKSKRKLALSGADQPPGR